MRYAFYLGCFAPLFTKQYELSTRIVAEKLGIELVDIEDFACCGYPIRSVDQETSLLLAARNLSVAESQNLDICTLCNGCACMLSEVNKRLKNDITLREKTNKKLGKIGRQFTGNIRVRHFARVLYEEIGPKKIKSLVKHKMTNLKLASHYGCHYLKPSHTYEGFEDHEFPTTLEKLVLALGAETVEYMEKTQCCGGTILDVDDKVALSMTKNKLDNIKRAGADAICLICPLCSSMYDRNQRLAERKFDTAYNLPVLFYPQILGLALGIDPKNLGLEMNRVKTSDLINKIVLQERQ